MAPHGPAGRRDPRLSQRFQERHAEYRYRGAEHRAEEGRPPLPRHQAVPVLQRDPGLARSRGGGRAHGEEAGVFPLLETVAPLVAEAYINDHRGLDAAYDALDAAYEKRDPLETARAAAAFRFHLNMHLGKEDTHLYRIFEERVPLPEQAEAVGVLSALVPPERLPEVVAWLFPLIGHDDRENVTRILRMNLPPDAFAGARALIRKAVGGDWAELARRIPELEAR
jgi:hypothetical protein